MAMDCIRKVYDHLVAIKKKKKSGKVNVDLFLYSNGGDGTVPWKLVTLIREYSKKFSVLVPYRAFSAATLTCLGADEIVMHPMGMLGPTDPTVANDFNPDNPKNPQTKLGISVEDVTAFISLIKDEAGITHEDELVLAFNKLTDKVHPLALGNVKRSLSQSRMMAKKLLALHMNEKDDHAITDIVENLTSKLFYHGHPINRTEAEKELGIKTIVKPDSHLEDLMWKLFLQYEEEMELNTAFDPVLLFSGHAKNHPKPAPGTPPTPVPPLAVKNKLCYVESEFITDIAVSEMEIGGILPNLQITPVAGGWIRE
jgi:hypothetical protein